MRHHHQNNKKGTHQQLRKERTAEDEVCDNCQLVYETLLIKELCLGLPEEDVSAREEEAGE